MSGGLSVLSSSVQPVVGSPLIKDEQSDIHSIHDAQDFQIVHEINDIEELPYHDHDENEEDNYSNQTDMPEKIEIRGIARLHHTDPEIQYLRQELHDVMRERRIAYLRQRIRRERQLLADEQADESNSDHRQMMMMITAPRAIGIKRRRSESISSVVSVRHARPPLEYKYRGKSINEFKTYMTRMESHFYHHSGYYVDDTRKINEAVTTLSDEMREQWDYHSDTLGPDRYTWQEFYGFFLDLLLRQPKRLAKQRKNSDRRAKEKTNQYGILPTTSRAWRQSIPVGSPSGKRSSISEAGY